ncbi:MAG: transposase [Vicinamibacterales bacterium]
MPRRLRHAPAGIPLHVVNRANDKRQIFFEDSDYERFLELLIEARQHAGVQIQAYCVMPNHFHLIAVGSHEGAISAFMQRLTCGHSRQLRRDTASQGSGHVYQGRFWSDAIRSDRDFLQVQRYIEANPVRAKLVERAELWRWSSLWERESDGRALLDPSPVALPDGWVSIVNEVAAATVRR